VRIGLDAARKLDAQSEPWDRARLARLLALAGQHGEAAAQIETACAAAPDDARLA